MSLFLARIGWLGRLLTASAIAFVLFLILDAALHGRHESVTPWVAGAIAGVIWRRLDRSARCASRCPHCHELVKRADARVCSHCGRDLHVMPVTEASAHG